MKRLDLTPAEYEQITVDIENAIEEFTELSKTVDWYCSDMPERLQTGLDIIRRAK